MHGLEDSFFKEIVGQLDAGLLITDAEQTIVYINTAYTELSNFKSDEVFGKQIEELIKGIKKKGEIWEGEVYIETKEGEHQLRWLYVNEIKGAKGETRFISYIIRDFHVCGFDPLTKLPNRLLLDQKLDLAINQIRNEETILAVLYLDLDRFKFVNDTLGHSYGDQLIQETAKRLQRVIGKNHTIVRMGGDEFVCLLDGLENEAKAEGYAKRIIESFAKPFHLKNTDLYVTVSIGISLFPYDGDDVETLVTNADSAMYRAKKNGRNRYEKVSVSGSAGAFEKLLLENSLRRAIEEEELILYFQPQIHLKNNEVMGVEALVRWHHPEFGLLPPGDFIPLAEETGLILPMGDWVLRTACEKLRQWQLEGLPPVRVAVNLSAAQFMQKDLIDKIDQILADTKVNPSYLEIEITENMVMQDVHSAIKTLNELKRRGIHLSIDDFGTGYSTFSYLKDFPIDTLKIDRTFIKDIDTNPSSTALTKAITSLAHDLDLKVIAEGVENQDQLAIVRNHACDAVQGFYFSKPLNETQITHYLRERMLKFEAIQ